MNTNPLPVLSVTRAMHANDTLATQVSEALHASEGATPIALDDIPEVSNSVESAFQPCLE